MKSKFLIATTLGLGLFSGCTLFDGGKFEDYRYKGAVTSAYHLKLPEDLSTDEMRHWKDSVNGTMITPRTYEFIQSFLGMSVDERRALLDSPELENVQGVLSSDFRDYFTGRAGDRRRIYAQRESERRLGFRDPDLNYLLTQDFVLIDQVLNGSDSSDDLNDFSFETFR